MSETERKIQLIVQVTSPSIKLGESRRDRKENRNRMIEEEKRIAKKKRKNKRIILSQQEKIRKERKKEKSKEYEK